jgi:hypothetical protein
VPKKIERRNSFSATNTSRFEGKLPFNGEAHRQIIVSTPGARPAAKENFSFQ